MGFSTARKSLNYDVVVIGSDAGALLASRIQSSSHGIHSVYLVHQQSQANTFGGSSDKKRSVLPAEWLNKHALSHSGAAEVSRINRSDKTVLLNDSSIIHYNKLVIASELVDDYTVITGLQEALSDINCPVFTSDFNSKNACKNPMTWKVPEGASCFFYVPNDANRSVQQFSFLSAFDNLSKQAKNISFTVIVESSSLLDSTLRDVESHLLNEMANRGIKIIWNTKISEINNCTNSIHMISTQMESSTARFDQLYTIVPQKQPEYLENLIEPMATAGKQLLSVDQYTLAHSNSKHIFCIGNGIDIPSPSSFESTLAQIDIVSKNTLRSLEGQDANSFYSGYTKIPLLNGSDRLLFKGIGYGYGERQQESKTHKNWNTSQLFERFRYLLHAYLSPLFRKVILRGGVLSRMYFAIISRRTRTTAESIGRSSSSQAESAKRASQINYFVMNESIQSADSIQVNAIMQKKPEYFVITQTASNEKVLEETEVIGSLQSIQIKDNVKDSVAGVSAKNQQKKQLKADQRQCQVQLEEYSELEQHVWMQDKTANPVDSSSIWLFQEEQIAAQKEQKQEEQWAAAVSKYIQAEETKKVASSSKSGSKKKKATSSKKKTVASSEQQSSPSQQLASTQQQPQQVGQQSQSV